MYSVVKFASKELLEVPSSWLEPSGKGFNCLWPSDNKAKEYIRKHKEPGKKWSRIPVKILAQECETLEAAKEKCEEFLEESSTATEGGNTSNTLRRKSLTDLVEKRHRSRSPLKQQGSTENERQTTGSERSEQNQEETNQQNQKETNQQNQEETNQQNHEETNQQNHEETNQQNQEEMNQQNQEETNQQNTENQDKGSTSKEKPKFTKEMEAKCLQDVYDICFATYEIVVGNRSKLKTVMKYCSGSSIKSQKESNVQKLVPVPLEKKEDVLKLEEDLKKNPTSREILKAELKILRSSDQSEYFRKMLHHIFGFKAAGCFTFKGQKRSNSTKDGYPSLLAIKGLIDDLLTEEYGAELMLSKIEKSGDTFFRNAGTKRRESLQPKKVPEAQKNTSSPQEEAENIDETSEDSSTEEEMESEDVQEVA